MTSRPESATGAFGTPAGRPEKILLAADGSGEAALAARAAMDIAEGFGTELHVVHAWRAAPRPPYYSSATSAL